MATIIAKWGNSLAVRLPVEVTRKAGINAGDRVEITAAQNGSLTISPARPKYSLEALVERITPQNLHGETDWGEQLGSEVW